MFDNNNIRIYKYIFIIIVNLFFISTSNDRVRMLHFWVDPSKLVLLQTTRRLREIVSTQPCDGSDANVFVAAKETESDGVDTRSNGSRVRRRRRWTDRNRVGRVLL